jgi:hypothetical protein
MKKALIFCFFALMFLSVNSFGQTEKFVKECFYRLEDEDSKSSAKTKAQEELRKMLSTEVLGFVRKYNASHDLSSEDISVNLYKKAITANVRDKLKILDEKFDGYEYWIKGEIEADVYEINTSAAELKKKEDEDAAAVVHTSQTSQTAGSSGQNVASAIVGSAATAAVNTAADIAQGAIGGAAANVVGNVAVGKLGGLAKGGLKGAAGAIGGAAASAAVNAAAGIAQDAIEGAAQGIVSNIAGGGSGTHSGGSSSGSVEISQETLSKSAKREGRYFVYSMRGEYIIMSETKGVGGCIEIGRIGKSNFYNTSQFSSGFLYFGFEQNLGACLNKDGAKGNYKSIIGGSLGMREVAKDFIYHYPDGDEYTVSTGHTAMYGVFYKLLFGDKNNFDITNKFMFGFRSKPVPPSKQNYYERTEYEYTKLNLTYVLSVGYTLTKKR